MAWELPVVAIFPASSKLQANEYGDGNNLSPLRWLIPWSLAYYDSWIQPLIHKTRKKCTQTHVVRGNRSISNVQFSVMAASHISFSRVMSNWSATTNTLQMNSTFRHPVGREACGIWMKIESFWFTLLSFMQKRKLPLMVWESSE